MFFQHITRKPILLIICAVACIAIIIITAVVYNALAAASQPVPPNVKAVHCGDLYIHGADGKAFDVGGKQGTVKQVGDCFWNAYQQCHAATLTLHQMGVDAGTIWTFTVEQQQGRCGLAATSQFYNVNFGGNQPPARTSSCAGLTRDGDSLRFSGCGEAGGPIDIVVMLA